METLEEAIGDLHSAGGHHQPQAIGVLPDMMTVAEAAEEIVPAARPQGGILFGREDRGPLHGGAYSLPGDRHDPGGRGMPSLNLSHAVQVVAYELFRASLGPLARRCADLADLSEQEALIRRVNDLLLAVGFRPSAMTPVVRAHAAPRLWPCRHGAPRRARVAQAISTSPTPPGHLWRGPRAKRPRPCSCPLPGDAWDSAFRVRCR